MELSNGGALAGRVCIVTGVSRSAGIGAAIAARLVADGASVYCTGWSAADAEQAWSADPAGGRQVIDILEAGAADVDYGEWDLGRPEAAQAVFDAARDRFGPVSILVANHARSSAQSLRELTAEELDLTYAVNTRATLLLVKALDDQQDRAGPGRVVLFTSGQYHGAMPGELPYIASKGALAEVTASLAVELMARGITVNCINPGPTDTGYADGDLARRVAVRMPAKRWGTPSDAARLVSWLVSDDAAWVTGQIIASDGGWSALGSS